MAEFLLLVLIVLFVILLNKQTRQSSDIEKGFNNLDKKILELQKRISGQIPKEDEGLSAPKEVPVEPQEQPASESSHSAATVADSKVDEDLVPEDVQKAENQQIEVAAFSEAKDKTEFKEEITPVDSPSSPSSPHVRGPQKSWLQRFKEKNPDIERFIGENLINKIGILILVLGISFFVKYAIDKDWINEPARVGIGILCGAIVMAFAHRLRQKYKAFSSVLVAGAVSIFYFTIGIAFHDYQLFSQAVAFSIMVVITAFSAFISISYDRKELAILTLIGGFAVPLMVSTGTGNYQVLFTYVAVLNLGMLILAYFKKWNIVTLLAFLFTEILYASWFGTEYPSKDFPYGGAFVFATIFYFIFSIAPVLNNIRNKGKFTIPEYLIMLANTFFYFGIGAFILQNWLPESKGLFTLSLALYNFIYGFILYKRFGLNKDAIYFLLGLALTFITITIPFQFNGNYITLFWAAEAVLLLWLSQKSKIAAFKVSAIIVQILMIISMIMDWGIVYTADVSEYPLPLFINKIFITGLFATASLVLSYFLLTKENEPAKFYSIEINPITYRGILVVASLLLGYFTGFFETFYQAFTNFQNDFSAGAYVVMYHFIFTAALIYFLVRNEKKERIVLALVLALVNILLYTVFFGRFSYEELKMSLDLNLTGQSAYYIHYLLLACIVYFFFVLIKHKKETGLSAILNHKISIWLFAFFTVIILSGELMMQSVKFSGLLPTLGELAQQFPANRTHDTAPYVRTQYLLDILTPLRIQIVKIGYPILWGLLSFIFLILGIRRQNQQLRIAALALLGIVILKLFIYDIRNVSETGKIIAFILLGVLILLISFMYQKIKQLVVETPKDDEHEENH